MVEVSRSLQEIISSTPGVSSIFITDRDGVPIASAGIELRSRTSIVQSYQSTVEQTTKLEMGAQKCSIFFYDQRQVAVLSVQPMIVFVVCSGETNTGVLMKLGKRMEPLLEQVEKVISLP